jgi:hypothetical protein
MSALSFLALILLSLLAYSGGKDPRITCSAAVGGLFNYQDPAKSNLM